ncbi:MAG: glycosyltransferase [Oscillospiraceae bacterium]|nr:glycosyltransferase [Oscillospiraceae bacterium]
MKLVFVSNYFNHHQKPFCEEMYRRLGNDFVFISTSVMREERRKLGYVQDDHPAYVCLAYESERQKEAAMTLIRDADVVIAGSAPDDMLRERILAGKLLFRYSERPFKKKTSCLKRIGHAIRFHRRDLWKKNVYMLCASAYAAGDHASVGMYRGRTYRWGYFPQTKGYDLDALMARKKRDTLMWCGRFIDWKHPDDAIMVAKRLKDHGYDFRLDMVGTGVMEAQLRQLVERYDLADRVRFLGAMTPDQVRIHMEEAGVYLFTSDRQEGWGAVLNESMNSGCAVVASHAIGSVPSLICNNQNGSIYSSGDVDMLYQKIVYLLSDPEEQKRLGSNAYATITETWNVKVAAERLIALINRILGGERSPVIFENGPCSQAEIIKDDWFNG